MNNWVVSSWWAYQLFAKEKFMNILDWMCIYNICWESWVRCWQGCLKSPHRMVNHWKSFAFVCTWNSICSVPHWSHWWNIYKVNQILQKTFADVYKFVDFVLVWWVCIEASNNRSYLSIGSNDIGDIEWYINRTMERPKLLPFAIIGRRLPVFETLWQYRSRSLSAELISTSSISKL